MKTLFQIRNLIVCKKVLDRIDGNEETLPSLIDRVYEKIITTKDTQCYINLNGKSINLLSSKCQLILILYKLLENNLVIILMKQTLTFLSPML